MSVRIRSLAPGHPLSWLYFRGAAQTKAKSHRRNHNRHDCQDFLLHTIVMSSCFCAKVTNITLSAHNIFYGFAYQNYRRLLFISPTSSCRKTTSEIKKTMSDVEKTTSDVGKIISDLFFAVANI